MVDEGVLKKSKNKTFREADDLPGVMVIRVTGLDEHGDMVGEPEVWKQDGPKPKVIVREGPISKKSKGHNTATVGVGGRALWNNDLVWFQSTRRNQGDLRLAEIVETVGSADGGKAASLISLYQHEIPVGFPDDV